MIKGKGIFIIAVFLIGAFLTRCDNSSEVSKESDELNEPLIVETDEKGYDSQLKITHTIPTEGMEDGPYEKFYPSGALEVEGAFLNGKRSGLWTSYHPGGNKQSESYYVNGVLDGKSVVFYPNGQIWYIGYYTNGKNDGQWIYFDKEGTLVKEVVYQNGKVISEVEKNEKPSE